jgi:hypothetical protein
MRRILLLVLTVVCFSCSTGKEISSKDLIGNFYGATEDYIRNTETKYYLELNGDNVFKLKINGHDYRPECSGVWEQKGDTITLKCSDTESLGEKLSSGYMNQREFKIKVQSRNKLKLDKVILKRQ